MNGIEDISELETEIRLVRARNDRLEKERTTLLDFIDSFESWSQEQLVDWLAHCVKTTRDMTLILAVANGSYQVRFHSDGAQFSPRMEGILQ